MEDVSSHGDYFLCFRWFKGLVDSIIGQNHELGGAFYESTPKVSLLNHNMIKLDLKIHEKRRLVKIYMIFISITIEKSI
jgi:hypothetical protein